MRRKDIDWLRLFGILLLFPFHAARVFDSRETNYVSALIQNPNHYSSMGMAFMSVIWPWFMPLLFLVAGISAWYALQKRDGRKFLNERLLRLLVPLVLGIILIVPIQGYMARLQRGTLHGGYINYVFTQFFPDFSDLSGYTGTFTPAHLWFILYLFIISVVLMPLMLHLVKTRTRGAGAFSRLFDRGWFLMLLFIPLTISEVLPDIGGKNPFFYGLYFAIGFFLASREEAWRAVDRVKWVALGTTAVSIPIYFFLQNIVDGNKLGDMSWQAILLGFTRNLYGFSALLVMLAFAQKYLNRGGKVLDYLNQAAFPVYILHQSLMMVIAYFTLQWIPGMTVQYFIILSATLVASLLLFEVCRHIPPVRIVLGIKKPRPSPQPRDHLHNKPLDGSR